MTKLSVDGIHCSPSATDQKLIYNEFAQVCVVTARIFLRRANFLNNGMLHHVSSFIRAWFPEIE
jgi:hypothetical protein